MTCVALSLVVALFVGVNAAATGCPDGVCVENVMLATHARIFSERTQVSQESAQKLNLPKLAALTHKLGLPNLLEMQGAVERMLNDTLNISNRKTGYERTYDPTTGEEKALEVVRGYLANILAATKTEHSNAQQLVKAVADQVSEVNREMADHLASVDQLQQQLEARRTSHMHCRTAEALVKRNKDTQCGRYEEHRAKDVDPSLQTVINLWKSSSPGETTMLNEAILAAKKWICDGDVFNSTQGCIDTSLERTSKRAECKGIQTMLEVADCEWHKKNDEGCAEYDTRFEYERNFYLRQHDVFLKGEETRKAEHVAAKRVSCYLDVLNATQVNKSEMMMGCRTALHSVNHLNVEYPQLPEKYTCNLRGASSSKQTCGEDWLQSEYKDQPWYTDANAEECAPCPTPAPTPAPTIEASTTTTTTTATTTQACPAFTVIGTGSCLNGESQHGYYQGLSESDNSPCSCETACKARAASNGKILGGFDTRAGCLCYFDSTIITTRYLSTVNHDTWAGGTCYAAQA